MSFFKRAFSAAMTRREELRDANIEEFEEDVDRGLKLLEQASENKKQSDAIIKNRKKNSSAFTNCCSVRTWVYTICSCYVICFFSR